MVDGDYAFLLKQAAIASGGAIYAFAFTLVTLALLDGATTVRATDKEEASGLDSGRDGGTAYD
ncbi:MAG: hypothetical protein KKA67_11610 [Spirochaetes bacterium]|nr:hypothetical protein [Spirochaetota bacterium]MBU1080380.1 hypothetical protein [Spirochaetota bacterium]